MVVLDDFEYRHNLNLLLESGLSKPLPKDPIWQQSGTPFEIQ